MKVVEARPIRLPWMISTLKGFADIPDLPIGKVVFVGGEEAVVSVWQASLWARIKFLFGGKINLVVSSPTHPPVSICIGDYQTLGKG